METQARSQPSAPSENNNAAEGEAFGKGPPTVPGIVPAVFFGDLRAGDGVLASKSIELCRSAGVQAFSLRYLGGEGEEGARRAGAAAADFEWEDVSVCSGAIFVLFCFIFNLFWRVLAGFSELARRFVFCFSFKIYTVYICMFVLCHGGLV